MLLSIVNYNTSIFFNRDSIFHSFDLQFFQKWQHQIIVNRGSRCNVVCQLDEMYVSCFYLSMHIVTLRDADVKSVLLNASPGGDVYVRAVVRPEHAVTDGGQL